MSRANYIVGPMDLEDWIERSFQPIVGRKRVGELELRTADPGRGDIERAVEAGIITGGAARVIGKRRYRPDIKLSFRGELMSREGAVSATANDDTTKPGDGYEGGSARMTIAGSLAAVDSTPADIDGGMPAAPDAMTISGNVGFTWDSASGSGTLYVTVNSESTSVSVVGTGSGSGVGVLSNPVTLAAGDSLTIQMYTSGITVNSVGVAMFGVLT